jgi:hypothetical protein
MNLDQFYTKREIAEECCNLVDFSKYSSILEPSAGGGAFLEFLPDCDAIDLEPAADGILQADFLSYSGHQELVIGNPPFGRVSSTAIKFFNHAATFAQCIAFIIPRTFRRISVQNKLDMNFHLVLDHEVPMGSFIPESMKAKCCFQVWERRDTKREKVELPMTHKDFEVLSYVTVNGKVAAPEGADFAVRAYGGNVGTISLDIEELAPKSWHFIKSDIAEDIIDRFETLDYYPLAGWTARQDSIGKAELIYLYNQKNPRGVQEDLELDKLLR